MTDERRDGGADAMVIKAAFVQTMGGEGCRVGSVRETEVTFDREADFVRAIHVHCRCGETTTVRCEYEEEQAS